jgi:SAM-dependent methyltransferase
MLSQLDIPTGLGRNHPSIRKAGIVRTGKLLIEKTIKTAGLESLAEKRVLDVGCGTRFTKTILTKKIPIKSYTGIDVDQSVIEYLKANVEVNDERFDYAHWDVINALYNESGISFNGQSELPISSSRKFDMIWMFSVITHQFPEGTSALFKILRNYVSSDGQMFFTAHTRSGIDQFADVLEGEPLMEACYQPEYLAQLLDEAGWKVDTTIPADSEHKPILHQNGFLCSTRQS